MKILFLTDLFPISNNNEPKTLSDFVNIWKQLGNKVDVIRPNFLLNTLVRNKKIVSETEIVEHGINILNLNFISPFWFDVKKKLPKNFDIDAYDVVVAHMPSGILFAQSLLKNKKIPLVCSVHASDIEVLTNPVYKLYFAQKMKKAYLRADLVTPRSYVLELKILSLMPQLKGKTQVAYSGIEKDYIESKSYFDDRCNSLVNEKELKIVSVASLIKRKKIDSVLKALAKLENQKWSYSIIGSGKELNALKRLSKDLKIDNKVDFLLNIPREEVLEKLKQSNAFVLLSEKETFGISYLEAMSKANIVIAKKNDGIDGILKHNENAFLADSIDDLVDILSDLQSISSDNLKNIYENMYKTINTYTLDKAAENYLNNIEKII